MNIFTGLARLILYLDRKVVAFCFLRKLHKEYGSICRVTYIDHYAIHLNLLDSYNLEISVKPIQRKRLDGYNYDILIRSTLREDFVVHIRRVNTDNAFWGVDYAGIFGGNYRRLEDGALEYFIVCTVRYSIGVLNIIGDLARFKKFHDIPLPKYSPSGRRTFDEPFRLYGVPFRLYSLSLEAYILRCTNILINKKLLTCETYEEAIKWLPEPINNMFAQICHAQNHSDAIIYLIHAFSRTYNINTINSIFSPRAIRSSLNYIADMPIPEPEAEKHIEALRSALEADAVEYYGKYYTANE